ncbi:hypothetical protein JHN63_14565 [Streptomyces sp. MBT65]|uniref:hypothetical protein n=1 Tax=Streptomyces sp. MBT65 TaxID=1488395 RepID=UPI00190A37EB|nr:hypothetical protein [Streptomyces sp. MBT65]MBK3575011.1 hypothetical protein [Streptomyces sp. MBT65]
MGELQRGQAAGCPRRNFSPRRSWTTRTGESAGAAGRDPSRTNRVYNLVGDRSTTQRVDLLTSWSVEHGMNGYIFSGPVDESALRPIIEKVAPAVREAVAKEHRR